MNLITSCSISREDKAAAAEHQNENSQTTIPFHTLSTQHQSINASINQALNNAYRTKI